VIDATRLQKLRVATEGPALRIKLYNPERRNAIGLQMTNELLHVLAEAHANDAVRVVVIEGEGKSFCAGGDFAQMTNASESDGPPLASKGDYADLLLALVRSEKPIIAKVNGHAMGGGLGIVAASTFAVASSEAQLGTPEISVGLFPMMIMAVLSRIVPRRRLLQMMLFGEKISVEEGKALGLVGDVVPPAELEPAVQALIAKVVGKSPLTMKLGLRAFAAQDDLELEKALPMLRDRLAECLGTDDAREGLMAFLEKRPPVWTGK
jgi:enoyl-CoA hydratase/carnithine racemase